MREHGRPISQQRFAALAGYSKRTQERYETGKSEPRLAHLRRIVELTGESQDFFFGGPSALGLAAEDDEEAASMAPLAADRRELLEALHDAIGGVLAMAEMRA